MVYYTASATCPSTLLLILKPVSVSKGLSFPQTFQVSTKFWDITGKGDNATSSHHFLLKLMMPFALSFTNSCSQSLELLPANAFLTEKF